MARLWRIIALSLALGLTVAGCLAASAAAGSFSSTTERKPKPTTTTSTSTTSSTTSTSTTTTSTTSTTVPAGAGVSGGSQIALAGIDQAAVLVTFSCVALADDVATAVSVDSCELMQDGVSIASAIPVSLPGLTAATANDEVVDLGAGRLEICWSVSATFLDGSTASETDCGQGILD